MEELRQAHDDLDALMTICIPKSDDAAFVRLLAAEKRVFELSNRASAES